MAKVHDREPPDDAPAATYRAFEAEADAAVHQERLARDERSGLVTALAGPAPCRLIVEGGRDRPGRNRSAEPSVAVGNALAGVPYRDRLRRLSPEWRLCLSREGVPGNLKK